MSLYSNSLCGLVLLTDSRVQCVAGVEGELAGIAMRSTEFHFPTLEQQLEGVRAEVKRSSSWRTDYWAKKAAAEAALGGGDGSVAEVKRDFSALNTGTSTSPDTAICVRLMWCFTWWLMTPWTT